MKFNLTITDLTADQLAEVQAKLGLNSAATAPVAYSAPQANEVEEAESSEDVTGKVDAEGLPWDKRIHSSNKKTNKDGTWARRRGLAEDTYLTIKAELQGAAPAAVAPQFAAPQPVYTPPVAQATEFVQPAPQFAAPQPVYTPPVAPVAPSPTPTFVQPQFPAPAPVAPVAQAAPAPAPVAPVAQAAPAPAPTGELTFGAFMQHVNMKMGQKVFDTAYLGELVGKVNVGLNSQFNSVTEFATQPQALAYAVSILQHEGKW